LYKRLLMVILLGPLACGAISGQESGVVSNTILPDKTAKSATRTISSFQLKGVLISSTKRTALINGQMVQEGDRVAGLEIIAIDQDGVRVLRGARELSVAVGGTLVGDQWSNEVSRIPQEPTSHSRHEEQRAAAFDVGRVPRSGADVRHAVKPGETLSGIALRYLRDGVTINQMMITLFQSNPQAFGNNINMLREGAILGIPDENELRRHTTEMATVEVVRQTDTWQVAYPQRTEIANSLSNKEYGPVESGETLSGIAARLLHGGTTMNQMMIALFQSNPQAFNNNINVLHAGATLRIPEKNEVYRLTPDTATAEVVRQTKAWQSRYEQHAQLTLAHSEILASNDELIN